MPEIDLMDRYPRSKRDINARSEAKTAEHRRIAREFGREFFDGAREYGYGGYSYQPRFWQPTVRRFQEHYQLAPNATILDVGCAKGFMLHDFKEFMPGLTVAGLDLSSYAIEHALPSVKTFCQVGDCRKLPYPDHSFDLVISINTIHNLEQDECKTALREIMRVTKKHAFVMVDAWRTAEEKERLFNWVLTARTMLHVDDWKKLFDEAGYTGDYFWFIA